MLLLWFTVSSIPSYLCPRRLALMLYREHSIDDKNSLRFRKYIYVLSVQLNRYVEVCSPRAQIPFLNSRLMMTLMLTVRMGMKFTSELIEAQDMLLILIWH